MASTGSTDHLVWRTTTVNGQTAQYGVAGDGLPVLFLHGWALGSHAYKRALKRLVRLDCRVYAPALPGFGETAELPTGELSFAGFAAWVTAFLDAVGVAEPMFVVGHSFGGGVAIQLAHDCPDRVRYLVLVNSVGGTTWSAAGSVMRSVLERPPWEWWPHLPEAMWPLKHARRVLPIILEDALPNLVHNPLAMLRVANLLRRNDLVAELGELRRRQLPVVVIWGREDTIIPRASFDALCAAIGSEGEMVPGRHSWLLADPDAFGEILTNSIAVAKLAGQLEAADKEHGENGPGDGAASPGLVRRIADRLPHHQKEPS